MLIDISFNSARLEGNTYTLADTENLVLQGISATGKLNEERIMILNHKEAIQYLVQNIDDLPLNENTVCTLHYLLADSLVAPNMAGKIRDDLSHCFRKMCVPSEAKNEISGRDPHDLSEPFDNSQHTAR